MIDIHSEFRDSMRSAGLEPPNVIVPGKLHRFSGRGKQNNNTASWCILFDDGLGGCFGDWSTGLSESWQVTRKQPFTDSQRDEFNRHVAEAKAQAEAERKARQIEAATKATEIWNASTPAPDDHPYLVRKGIKVNGARLHNKELL